MLLGRNVRGETFLRLQVPAEAVRGCLQDGKVAEEARATTLKPRAAIGVPPLRLSASSNRSVALATPNTPSNRIHLSARDVLPHSVSAGRACPVIAFNCRDMVTPLAASRDPFPIGPAMIDKGAGMFTRGQLQDSSLRCTVPV